MERLFGSLSRAPIRSPVTIIANFRIPFSFLEEPIPGVGVRRLPVPGSQFPIVIKLVTETGVMV